MPGLPRCRRPRKQHNAGWKIRIEGRDSVCRPHRAAPTVFPARELQTGLQQCNSSWLCETSVRQPQTASNFSQAAALEILCGVNSSIRLVAAAANAFQGPGPVGARRLPAPDLFCVSSHACRHRHNSWPPRVFSAMPNLIMPCSATSLLDASLAVAILRREIEIGWQRFTSRCDVPMPCFPAWNMFMCKRRGIAS